MNMNFMIASYFILWAIVISMALFVISLSRKPKRILPASQTGLPTGEMFPEFKLSSIQHNIPFRNKNPNHKAMVVLFTSQLCPICQTIYPLLTQVEKKHDIKTVVFMEPQHHGDITGITNIIKEKNIEAPVYELTEEIKNEVKLGAFPFAYFLSKDGIILSKGVVLQFDDFGLLINQGRRAAAKRSIINASRMKMQQTG